MDTHDAEEKLKEMPLLLDESTEGLSTEKDAVESSAEGEEAASANTKLSAEIWFTCVSVRMMVALACGG